MSMTLLSEQQIGFNKHLNFHLEISEDKAFRPLLHQSKDSNVDFGLGVSLGLFPRQSLLAVLMLSL